MKRSLRVLAMAHTLALMAASLGCMFYLARIPADAKNSVLFGFSAQRLILMAVFVVGALSGAGGLWLVWRRPAVWGGGLDWLYARRWRAVGLFFLCASIWLLGWVGGWWAEALTERWGAYIERLYALFIWMSVCGGVSALALWAAGWVNAPLRFRRVFSERSVLLAGGCILVAAAGPGILATAAFGLALRYDLWRLWIPLALVWGLWMFPTGRGGRWLGLAGTLLIFLLPLLGLWAQAESEQYVLLGMFPINDAHGYYQGALHLLNSGALGDFAARRPLFPALLASFLRLTGGHLPGAIFLIVLLAALAAYLLGAEVRRMYGVGAAVLVLWITFVFYRHFAGSLLTENLGFACGAAGFALLWRGMYDRRARDVLVGVFLLSLGLNARAGAFFLLPVLVLWAAWYLGAGRFSWRYFALGVAAVGAGFAVNELVYRLASPAHTVLFSNFSYTLYGLVMGGKGWGQIWIDYPELKTWVEPQLSRQIYALCWQAFLSNPFNTVVGAGRAWADFFSTGFHGMFGFLGRPDRWASVFLYALSLLGLAEGLRRKDAAARLLLAALAGVVASVPFVPTVDAGLRSYAVVIPLFALLPAYGLAILLGGVTPQATATCPPLFSRLAPGFGAVLAALIVLGPIWLWAGYRPAQFGTLDCPAGQEAVYLRLPPGGYLHILEDERLPRTWLPQARWSDFHQSIHDFEYASMVEELNPLIAPAVFGMTYDLRSDEFVWLIAQAGLLPDGADVVGVCGVWGSTARGRSLGYLHAQSMRAMNEREGR